MKLESLNSEKFKPLNNEQLLKVRGGETSYEATTGGGTVLYLGKSYHYTSDVNHVNSEGDVIATGYWVDTRYLWP